MEKKGDRRRGEAFPTITNQVMDKFNWGMLRPAPAIIVKEEIIRPAPATIFQLLVDLVDRLNADMG